MSRIGGMKTIKTIKALYFLLIDKQQFQKELLSKRIIA